MSIFAYRKHLRFLTHSHFAVRARARPNLFDSEDPPQVLEASSPVKPTGQANGAVGPTPSFFASHG